VAPAASVKNKTKRENRAQRKRNSEKLPPGESRAAPNTDTPLKTPIIPIPLLCDPP
jgi:hypothetical protein